MEIQADSVVLGKKIKSIRKSQNRTQEDLAFGFTNSHMHEFELSSEDLKWVTAGKVENWKKLVGLVFKNPLRDEDLDFWDDDYEGGSPKKWMRSKYTGPGYVKCYEEGYDFSNCVSFDACGCKGISR